LPDQSTLWGDQAAGLRRLFGGRSPQVVAFASGREACARTTLVVQSAAALAAAGHGVVIVDENQGPDNTLAAFGVASRHDLMQVLSGERALSQIMLQAAPLIRIVPASQAAREFDLPARERGRHAVARQRLQASLAEMQRGAGFVLIDTAAARGGHLSVLALAARHVAVVVAAHSAAITQAYALIKRLARECGRNDFQMVVSRARSREEAQAIFDNMRRVAGEHLGVRLHFLGDARVPVTDHLAEALLTRLPQAGGEDEGDGFLALRAPGAPMVTLDSVV
jgi:flagellar biosynthesis protein FlhG